MLQGAPAFPGDSDVFGQLQEIWTVTTTTATITATTSTANITTNTVTANGTTAGTNTT